MALAIKLSKGRYSAGLRWFNVQWLIFKIIWVVGAVVIHSRVIWPKNALAFVYVAFILVFHDICDGHCRTHMGCSYYEWPSQRKIL